MNEESCFGGGYGRGDVNWSNEGDFIHRICLSCGGSGQIEKTCEQCEGRGCAWCQGTGKGFYSCPSCRGVEKLFGSKEEDGLGNGIHRSQFDVSITRCCGVKI